MDDADKRKNAFADNSPLSDSEIDEMYIRQLEKFEILEEFLKTRGIDNKVKSSGSFPLTDQDYGQMLDKFYTLEKFLKKEGLID